MGERARFSGTVASIPQASSVAVSAWKKFLSGESMSYLQIRPCYLKKSQAERENEERGKNNDSNRK